MARQHRKRAQTMMKMEAPVATPLIPEIFKSVQQRLRNIRNMYAVRPGSDDYFELEELARESYDALSRVNRNLLRMIEI